MSFETFKAFSLAGVGFQSETDISFLEPTFSQARVFWCDCEWAFKGYGNLERIV